MSRYSGFGGFVDNGVLFIIALFFLACCGCGGSGGCGCGGGYGSGFY